MKLYELNYDVSNCTYPDQMATIMGYLSEHGTLNCSIKEVETQYRQYSDEFWAAGWMDVDESILSSFAIYLSEQEV